MLASGAVNNVCVKLAGFTIASQLPWSYPSMTYRQSLELVRTRCTFIPDADKEWIMGKALARLLEAAPAATRRRREFPSADPAVALGTRYH